MSGEEKPRRLCSEIQLFDLCGKTVCKTKDGRFCTDETLLQKFEAISQEEDFPPDQYPTDGGEEGDDDADDAYGDYGEDYDDDEDASDEE